MKKLFLLAVLVIILLIITAGSFVFAQQDPLSLSPRATVQNNNLEIAYGQPSKRDRAIFGGLVPYDKVWRTGANQATEITFKKDAKFAGKNVKKGTYTLFTIPGQKEWTIILNSKLNQWGTFAYDDKADILRATVPSAVTGAVTEKFTITLATGKINMLWDKTSVDIPVNF